MAWYNWILKRKKKEAPETFTDIESNDSIVVESNDLYTFNASQLSFDPRASKENEDKLIETYRRMAQQPEIDIAIDEIVNEAIASDDGDFINLNLNDIDLSERIKKKMIEEFDEIKGILNLYHTGHDLFRRWYIDGRMYHQILLNDKRPSDGIVDVRYIDPRKIKKVIEITSRKDEKTGVVVKKVKDEYFLYNDNTINSSNKAIRIHKDNIVYTTSGLMNENNQIVLSYLHKAIRPFNQLRTLEDSVVIYRLVRAPERRAFYIDVGNLPTTKAEQFLHNIKNKHKTKLTYDPETGMVNSQNRFMTMMEDYWFARREGSRGTEIEVLQGGQNLGEMDDVDYFKHKLYRALNVPITRLESETGFNIGRASEITRDEVKFQKFINRLRNRFSEMFTHLLKVQLAAKGIMTIDEFEEIEKNIKYIYAKDNHFSKLKDLDILREKLSVLSDIESYVGEYFSKEWVQRNVLDQTDQEIAEIEKESNEEDEEDEEDEDFEPKEKINSKEESEDKDKGQENE